MAGGNTGRCSEVPRHRWGADGGSLVTTTTMKKESNACRWLASSHRGHDGYDLCVSSSARGSRQRGSAVLATATIGTAVPAVAAREAAQSLPLLAMLAAWTAVNRGCCLSA